MSKQTIVNYTFNAGSKTVTFIDFSSVNLSNILGIINATSGTTIFQVNNSALGGTISGNVLTLSYDTTSMSNSDKLQIWYMGQAGDPVYTPTVIGGNNYGGPVNLIRSWKVDDGGAGYIALAGTQQIQVMGAAAAGANFSGALNPIPFAGKDYGIPDRVQIPKVDSGGALYTTLGGINSTLGSLNISPSVMSIVTMTAWNSGTNVGATQNIFTSSATPAILVQLDQTTVITGGAITFDITYDGTNWVTPSANLILDPTSTAYVQISLPYTLQSGTNKPFLIINNGFSGLRIRLTSLITIGSGSPTVTPSYALLPFAPGGLVTASQSGTWTVGSNSPAGSTVPNNAYFIGFKNSSSNLQGALSVGSQGLIGGGSDGLLAIGSYTYNGTSLDVMKYAGQPGSLMVGGAVAANNNVSSANNPILIGGSDYGVTPKTQTLKIDNNGTAYMALAGIGSTSGSLNVAITSGGISLSAPSTIYNNKVTVTSAGTRVALASTTTVSSVTVKSESTNIGTIYVGNATVSSSNGLQLLAGDSVSLDINDLSKVYIDASNSGDGVTYLGVA